MKRTSGGGRTIPQNIILYGPRGNGKTALTLWLQPSRSGGPLPRSIRRSRGNARLRRPPTAGAGGGEPWRTAREPACPPQLSIPGTRQERLKVWSLVSVTVTDSSPGSFGV